MPENLNQANMEELAGFKFPKEPGKETRAGRDIKKNGEYENLQKENFAEHEKWQKNLKEVVSWMKFKRDAMDEVVKGLKSKRNSAGSSIHFLIIAMGGGMQGAYCAGQLRALQLMDYIFKNVDSHDHLLGISTGAPISAFALAGKDQGLMGLSYFYTICCGKDFINRLRIYKIIDTSVITEAMKNSSMKLDVDAVMNHPARLYVQAYNEQSREPEFLDAKDPKFSMITAIQASMQIPAIYHKALTIGGIEYTDGAFDDPLPISRAIEKFKPTHVLVLPNMPFNAAPEKSEPGLSKLVSSILPRHGYLGVIRKVLESRQILRQSLNKIANINQVKIGVAWPPDTGLAVLSQDKELIKLAIKAAAHSMFELFGEPNYVLKFYEEEYGKLPA